MVENMIKKYASYYQNTFDNICSKDTSTEEKKYILISQHRRDIKIFQGCLKDGRPMGTGVLTKNNKQFFVEYENGNRKNK